MSSPALPPRCWAEIDLSALERNLRLIRASLPPHIRYVAVVKADAYGHGIHHVAARLMHSGADLLAVANVGEAAAIRELSADWPVLLLGPVLPDEDKLLSEYGLATLVSSAEEVDRFAAVGRAAGRPVAVHLKVDTGLGRMGVWHEAARPLYERIRAADGVELAGLCTHFASADDDPVFTAEQRARFLRVLADLPGLRPDQLMIHADNSAGLSTVPGDSPFNAVRIGLLQFGVPPHPNAALARVATEAVFSFHTRVGLVKRLPAGTGVSYGRTHTLRRDSTVAILTAGYGDGLARASGNRAQVLIRGRRCPVIGRVTMDQTIVDVTDLGTEVRCGDPVVLVGRDGSERITVAEFSAWSDTIPWETLCSVTKRVPRHYRTALGT